MIVIAFSGKRESGKDTGAQHLGQHWLREYASPGSQRDWPSRHPKKLAMADPLKKFVSQWFGIPIEWCNTQEGKEKKTHLLWESLPLEIQGTLEIGRDEGLHYYAEGWDRKSGPMTVREVLQIWGTNILRQADPNCHARRWTQEARTFEKGGTPVLFVTDVRFPNEVQTTLSFSDRAYLIRLNRRVQDDDHPSETALDDFTWPKDRVHFVDNADNSLEEYKTQLDAVFQRIMAQHPTARLR